MYDLIARLDPFPPLAKDADRARRRRSLLLRTQRRLSSTITSSSKLAFAHERVLFCFWIVSLVHTRAQTIRQKKMQNECKWKDSSTCKHAVRVRHVRESCARAAIAFLALLPSYLRTTIHFFVRKQTSLDPRKLLWFVYVHVALQTTHTRV